MKQAAASMSKDTKIVVSACLQMVQWIYDLAQLCATAYAHDAIC